MDSLKLLGRNWKPRLAALLRAAKADLLVASPYVTREGTKFVTENISPSFRSNGHVSFVTDLSPMNVCSKATEPSALRFLASETAGATITHLPRLHAKVYIADSTSAIVTSGNLTSGGLRYNFECGVEITERALVDEIRSTTREYAGLGVRITNEQLEQYCQIGEQVTSAYQAQLRGAVAAAKREFAHSLRVAEDELIRIRLAGGAVTPVFEKTIRYLLSRHGPLPTRELHPLVQAIHPDLCDDTVDRVINGHHFGKKWKHAVRRAQSHLKDAGEIELRDGTWQLSAPESSD
jgi:hypothetical protein